MKKLLLILLMIPMFTFSQDYGLIMDKIIYEGPKSQTLYMMMGDSVGFELGDTIYNIDKVSAAATYEAQMTTIHGYKPLSISIRTADAKNLEEGHAKFGMVYEMYPMPDHYVKYHFYNEKIILIGYGYSR